MHSSWVQVHVIVRHRMALGVGIVQGIHLCVALFLDAGNLLWRPRVQRDGLDAANVRAELAVDATTSNAQKHTQVPRSPTRTYLVSS